MSLARHAKGQPGTQGVTRCCQIPTLASPIRNAWYRLPRLIGMEDQLRRGR